MDTEQLKSLNESVNKLGCFTSFVFDLTQLCLATCTVLYFLLSRTRMRQLPWKIGFQIVLLWTQSLLYSIRNFWMVFN